MIVPELCHICQLLDSSEAFALQAVLISQASPGGVGRVSSLDASHHIYPEDFSPTPTHNTLIRKRCCAQARHAVKCHLGYHIMYDIHEMRRAFNDRKEAI